jgi:hypothetical protein
MKWGLRAMEGAPTTACRTRPSPMKLEATPFVGHLSSTTVIQRHEREGSLKGE